MIKTKEDLQYYLDEDRKAYGKPHPTLKSKLLQWLFPDLNWEFMRVLRKLEYHINNGGIYHRIAYFYYTHKHAQLRAKTGIELNPNCAGAGLHISHGKCVVSSSAQIGEHCKILIK